MHRHPIYSVAVVVLGSFFLPGMALAATVTLRATPTHVGVGDIVHIEALLDSAVPTNAFSGTLAYPNALEPIGVSDGNSIVSMWVVHPTVSPSPISFAGITPGGFSGQEGLLFSVEMRATKAGNATISLKDLEVLRNDGAGGKESVRIKPLTLAVAGRSMGRYAEPVDTTPPEPFTVQLGDDPHIAAGKKYLVFGALDKGSGVAQYRVAETRVPAFLLKVFPLSWVVTTSPYPLSNQALTSTVYLKVIDRAENERVSVFPRPHLFAIYEWAFLAILSVATFFFLRRGRRWRRKKNL